jgi:hypothetical protein
MGQLKGKLRSFKKAANKFEADSYLRQVFLVKDCAILFCACSINTESEGETESCYRNPDKNTSVNFLGKNCGNLNFE